MAQRGALSAGARIVRSRPAWIARLAARSSAPSSGDPEGSGRGPLRPLGPGKGGQALPGAVLLQLQTPEPGPWSRRRPLPRRPVGSWGAAVGVQEPHGGLLGQSRAERRPSRARLCGDKLPKPTLPSGAPCGASGRLARDWAGRWLRPQERGAWPACAVLECVPPGGEPAVSKRWHPAPQGQTLLRLSSCHRLPMLPGQLSGCSVGRLSLSQLWGQKLQPQRPGTSRRSLQWPPGEPTLRIASRPALKHPGPPEGRRGLEGPFPAPLPCPLL